MCGVLAACGPSGASHGKILRLALYGDPGALDPARASTRAAMFVDSLLFSGLVKFSPDLHVIPELAVSIPTISNDGRTYTFTVRQDARFADGRPCTGYDVAFSLARALSPSVHSAMARYYLGGIKGAAAVERGARRTLAGVRVIQRLTVRIRLSYPDASFLDKLALPVASIVESAAGSAAAGGRGPLQGAGPWMVAARGRDGSLNLVPRPHFYGAPLELGSLVLVPVPSDVRALQLYRKGAVDIVRVPAEQYGSMATRSDFHSSDTLDAYYALPDGADSLALAASLDRDRLVRDASPTLSSLATIVPPAVPDYVSSAPAITAPDGSDAPPRVVLQVLPPRDPVGRLLRRALARQWGTSGRGAEEDVRILHASAILPDPALWLRLLWGRSRSTWFVETLTYAMALTNDPVTRMSDFSQIESWALQKGLIIPLASSSVAYLVKPIVRSLQVTPLGIMPENNNWSQVSLAQP